MAQVYFHCSGDQGVLIDRYGTALDNLSEARDHAAIVVRSLMMAPGPQDWRCWVLHVRDDHGDELFELPFTAVIGKPN